MGNLAGSEKDGIFAVVDHSVLAEARLASKTLRVLRNVLPVPEPLPLMLAALVRHLELPVQGVEIEVDHAVLAEPQVAAHSRAGSLILFELRIPLLAVVVLPSLVSAVLLAV